VKVVGIRLKSARIAQGLTMREIAKRLGVDPAIVAKVEMGVRFPPKRHRAKFAKELSLTPEQLDAFISVERRGLNPYEMLPEIAPAQIPHKFIEDEADKILRKYYRAKNTDVIEGPIRATDVIKDVCGLSTEYVDFTKERIKGPNGGDLYGCLYPDVFRGKDRLVLVNTGPIDGRRLTGAEQSVTVAHEAGHYVLHHGIKEAQQLTFHFTKSPSFCREAAFRPTPFNSHEDQASAFAACLLMPRNHFLRQWRRYNGSETEMAKCFEVTEEFVLIRAEMLGLRKAKPE
jgi:transcriptional regulator with XRE-family HTH domain